MRFVFLLAWAVALYLVLRYLLGRWVATRRTRIARETLVQDPVCKVYLPKSRALTRTINGVTYHFCSESCLLKFPGLRVGSGEP